MTGKLAVLLKKFSIPVVFFIIGLIMIIVGMTKNQNASFMVAAIMMFAAGAISVLYSSGKLKPGFIYIIGLVAGVAAIATLYLSWNSVEKTNTYNKNYALCKSLAIQNLQDIRFVQKTYMEQNGKYIDNWDELVEYTKNGTMPSVKQIGLVPDTFLIKAEYEHLVDIGLAKKGEAFQDNKMSEIEAYHLSKWTEGPRYDRYFAGFSRDTVPVSILEVKFQNDAYVKSREVAGFPRFSADSLPYIPFTGAREKWMLETADSVLMGESKVPAIQVSGSIPFAKIQGTANEKLSFGKLTSNETAGSWED